MARLTQLTCLLRDAAESEPRWQRVAEAPTKKKMMEEEEMVVDGVAALVRDILLLAESVLTLIRAANP